MCIEPSQFKKLNQILRSHLPALCDIINDRLERSDANRPVIWHRDRVNVRCSSLHNDMGTFLSYGLVADASQRTHELRAVHVTRQLHAATGSRTRSSARCSRMRLGRSQDIIVIAEMSDGKFYSGRRSVKVTIGGCGG